LHGQEAGHEADDEHGEQGFGYALSEMRGQRLGNHVAGLRRDDLGQIGYGQDQCGTREHHHKPDQKQPQENRLGDISFGLVDFLRNRARRFKAQERPADVSDRQQHRP
jgi:hypothetical protein